jgi:ribosomal subunit interface protein
MKIEIAGLNYQVDDYTRDLVARKLVQPLDKLVTSFEPDLKIARLKIEQRTRWGYKLKLHIKLAGRDLFSEDKDKDLVSALVKVREGMEKQIKKHLEKLQDYSKN